MNMRRCAVENLEARELLTTVFVTSDMDSGEGSFRAAIESANADGEIDRIAFMTKVDTVELESSIEYTGNQSLNIFGRGTVLKPTDESAGSFDLFVSSGDADLRIRNMVFEDGANGIHVPISESATGNIQLRFLQVTVRNNDLTGILVNDQLDNSDAGLNLLVSTSTIMRNGIETPGNDGLRIVEGGEGNVHARVLNSRFEDNGGDGMKLEETNDGGVRMFTTGSTYGGNGFADRSNFEDGLDIDEEGDGNLWFRTTKSTFNNNSKQGLELTEGQGGLARVQLYRVDANANLAGGVKVEETNDGDASDNGGNLIVSFVHVQANLNQAGDGISVSEQGNGHLISRFISVVANSNAGDGIRLVESDSGNLRNFLVRTETDFNDADGIRIEEQDAGRFIGYGTSIQSNGNESYGLTLRQENGSDSDWGRMKIAVSELENNTVGSQSVVGVRVV